MLRLEVRRRTLLLDERDYVFITEDGVEVEKTTTEGVVSRVERFVKRRLRGPARVHGRAQILQSLRQFNSPKEGLTQFVAVEASAASRLVGLDGPARQSMLDDVVVRAVQARLPVDLQAIERWVREHGLWIGLTGKNQVLGGKVRLANEGIVSNFEPEKLLARSLLEKPEAFQGKAIRLLVVDDPFVDAVTGDGAFLLRASAPRDCERVVTQRVRRCLDYQAKDARRGEVFLRLEFEDKVARYDTEILEVVEDGDLLYIKKRERARIDTGAKLVHEAGFKGTAIVLDRLPEHIEHEWPCLDGVVNASCIKSNAILAAHSQEAMWGNFQRAFLLHLPVRMLFTGEERFSTRGNRVSLNVLSTVHSVSPEILDRIVESRVDEGPGAVVSMLLWWSDHLADDPGLPEGCWGLSVRSKADLRESWGESFERRFAFGDMPDHPMLDPALNPDGFVARGRGGNWVVVPSARALLATLGKVEVEGEHGFHWPDYVNSVMQAIRCLDVKPERFTAVREQLRENVVRAANAMLDAHSIRVPGLHGVVVAVKGLGNRVVVPDGLRPFHGLVHREPLLGRDGVRDALVEPLSEARRKGSDDPHAKYLLDHLVGEDFAVVMGDFERLTRMNADNDGDLLAVSRLKAKEPELQALDAGADQAPPFVDTGERWRDVSMSFQKLRADHDPFDLPPEAVHRAVLETAGSARDVGSITLWKYTAQEALAEAKAWDLLATVARIVQAYIDGMKSEKQASAQVFAALMRVWARMAVPCLAVKEDGVTKAVRLTQTLRRELLRAGYVEGRDFHGVVDVPHPSLVDEAFRKVKKPLVEILEEILAGIESQGLATRADLKRIRDVLERAYGQYPSQEVEDRASLVAERRAVYSAVRRLYGITPVRSLADVEAVGVRPLWKRLMSLSTDPGEGSVALDRLAQQALAYAVRPERVEL
jgi:hypothetical protein